MDITQLLSVFAIVVSCVFSSATLWHAGRRENADSTERQTTVIVKLENISSGIGEIKQELKSLKQEIKDHETRIIKLEERAKAEVHKL